MKRILWLSTLCIVVLVFLPGRAFAQCGGERWPVKIGADPDATLVNLSSTRADNAAIVLQQLSIPATAASANLSFWRHIDTTETTSTTAYDTLKVQIRNSSGVVLATLATYSNLNAGAGYTQSSFDLSAYKGQTIQIYLVGTEDSSLKTSFVVDDFVLNVTTP